MTSFIEEYRKDFMTSTSLVVWTCLSLSLGISGPFGTYAALPLVLRLLYWAVTIGTGMVVGSGVRAFVSVVLVQLSFRKTALISAALMSLLFTPPMYVFSMMMLRAKAPYLPNFFEVMLFVFSISLGIAAFRKTISPDAARTHAANEPLAPIPVLKPLPRLLQRIDPCLRGDLISISVRDHYVDVLTTGGQSSLLMRLSDAIAEVEDVDGGQVHRSHWVAWSAVQGVERDGAKVLLRMPYGARLPVSRNHRDKLETRGLV